MNTESKFEPNDKLHEEMHAQIKKIHSTNCDYVNADVLHQYIDEIYLAAKSNRHDSTQTPVLWHRYMPDSMGDNVRVIRTEKPDDDDKKIWQPLYAAPVPADHIPDTGKKACSTNHKTMTRAELSSDLNRSHLLSEAAKRADYFFRQIDGSYQFPAPDGQVSQVIEMLLSAQIADDSYDHIAEAGKMTAQTAPHWVVIDDPEDCPAGEDIVLWDGCQIHIDHTDTEVEYGNTFFANGTEATHYLAGLKPPQEDDGGAQ